MRTYEVQIAGCESRFIPAVSASKARYAYWRELCEILVPYAECFHAIKTKVSKMKITPTENPQILVDKFNSTYRVGDTISVRLDDQKVVKWTVRHAATILGGHTAVIWANEHSGCFLAARVIF